MMHALCLIVAAGFCANSNPSNIPKTSPNGPHGSYGAQIRMPPLPYQSITVRVDDRSEGTLLLQGAVNLEDKFVYAQSRESGEWEVSLGERTLKKMKKFRCELSKVSFDTIRDRAMVRLSMPLIGTFSIMLSQQSKKNQFPDL